MMKVNLEVEDIIEVRVKGRCPFCHGHGRWETGEGATEPCGECEGDGVIEKWEHLEYLKEALEHCGDEE